jgi:hypothetical protein
MNKLFDKYVEELKLRNVLFGPVSKVALIQLQKRIMATISRGNKNYNYMLIGAFDLLMAKQQEFEAYQKYLETLRDYWIVRADMQRSLGGRLPSHMQGRHRIRTDSAAENKMN